MKSVMLHDLLDMLRSEAAPIIIYGAAASGQALLHACRIAGIPVACFCDGNIKKKNTRLFDLDVIHVSDIKSQYPDALWIISAADIHEIQERLTELGYQPDRMFAAAELLKTVDLTTFRDFVGYNAEDVQAGFVEFAVKCAIQCQEGYLNPDKLFLRSIDIVVTEKCSLRCRDCSNLMQFFERPVNYTIEDMEHAIDCLCSCIDEIHEFRVIGGEPFMNKDVHHVIARLTREPKVKRVVVYTNATILPRPEQISCLKHEKVIFMITDYSRCGENVDDSYTSRLSRFAPITDRVETLCKENGIDYRRHPPENWTDAGQIKDFGRSVEEDKEVFRACCCKNLLTLSEGELHRCPFSAQITRLGVSDFKDDYVSVRSAMPVHERRAQLKQLLYGKDRLEACRFCPGRSLSDPQIVPAIQVRTPLQYEKDAAARPRVGR
jgi:hypothetical protein